MGYGSRCSVLLGTGLLLACGGGDAAAPGAAPATLTVVSGAAQTDTVAQRLDGFLDVLVRDADGVPVPGVLVRYAPVGQAGTISLPSVRTRPSGRASTAWTLPEQAGRYSVTASVAGLPPVVFTATAVPSYPAQLRRLSGDGQSGLEGETLDEVIVIQVTDDFGNGVEGMTVGFSLAPGNGRALNPQSKSDSLGQVSSLWELGPGPGPKRMQAKAPNLIPILLQATAVAAP
jgi:adhesin/invasin